MTGRAPACGKEINHRRREGRERARERGGGGCHPETRGWVGGDGAGRGLERLPSALIKKRALTRASTARRGVREGRARTAEAPDRRREARAPSGSARVATLRAAGVSEAGNRAVASRRSLGARLGARPGDGEPPPQARVLCITREQPFRPGRVRARETDGDGGGGGGSRVGTRRDAPRRRARPDASRGPARERRSGRQNRTSDRPKQLAVLVGAADRSVRSLDHPRRAPSDRQTTWFKFARKVQTRCATRPRASRLVRGRPA